MARHDLSSRARLPQAGAARDLLLLFSLLTGYLAPSTTLPASTLAALRARLVLPSDGRRKTAHGSSVAAPPQPKGYSFPLALRYCCFLIVRMEPQFSWFFPKNR